MVTLFLKITEINNSFEKNLKKKKKKKKTESSNTELSGRLPGA
jgi:hypothetical protein